MQWATTKCRVNDHIRQRRTKDKQETTTSVRYNGMARTADDEAVKIEKLSRGFKGSGDGRAM